MQDSQQHALDAQQFKQLFFEYHPRLVRFATRFVDGSTAEDIVQNCFMRLWNKRENILLTNIKSLLFMMVRNDCLNELKHRVVASTDSLDALMNEKGTEQLYWQDFTSDAETVFVGVELQNIVNEALMITSDKSREIFLMSRQQGMSPKEIAEKMGISRQAVEKHIHSVLAVLKKQLFRHFIWLMVLWGIIQLLFK